MSTKQKLLSKYVDTKSLNHVLNIGSNEDDEKNISDITLIKHSPYGNSDEFVSFCLEIKNKFNIFSLNIQRIKGKIDEFHIL